jgi:hypothetical protein
MANTTEEQRMAIYGGLPAHTHPTQQGYEGVDRVNLTQTQQQLYDSMDTNQQLAFDAEFYPGIQRENRRLQREINETLLQRQLENMQISGAEHLAHREQIQNRNNDRESGPRRQRKDGSSGSSGSRRQHD